MAPSRAAVNEPDVESEKGVDDDLEGSADDGGDEDAEDGAPEVDGNPAAANDVQLKGDASGGDAAVHDAAAQGLSGSATSLPHLDRIQGSFGPQHDVSGVQAHVGGAAADACDAIGASAYASGEATAFKSSPDLHTAAHEAAHVVQQKQGVSLYGGVGRAGDVHEQHADAVADRVVAGESAADLLGASSGGGSSSNAVQRKDGPEAHVPNNTYEVKLVIKEFNRVSIDARLTIAHKNSKLATGSQDVAGEGDNATKAKWSLLDNKRSFERKGGQWGEKLATALGKIELSDEDFHIPGFPQVKFKAEAKFLEGKFSKGEVDLDVAKLAVIGEGKAPELLDFFGVELPDGVRDNLDIKVSVRAEVALSAEDVARLARMSKHGREMAKHLKAMAKEAEKLKKLKKANKAIEKHLSALKKSKKKGTKKAREKLLEKLATNKEAMRTGAEKIARSKAGYQAAEAGFKVAAKGLKSGAGKMAAKALLKGSAKTLAKLGARLIPGLNIALAIVDVVELGVLLYKWADGQIEFGTGGGSGGGGTKSEDGGDGGGEEGADGGTGGVAGVGGDGADAGAGGDGGKAGVDVDADRGGGGDAGVYGATGPAGDQGTKTEPPLKLHAGAQAVLDLIESSDPGGVPFDNDDLQMFNDMIPKDLSDAELKEVAARIAKAGVPAGDAFAVVGYLREEIDRVRKGDPIPKVTVNGTDHSDLATDGKAPEAAAPTSPAQDVEIKAEDDKNKAVDDKKKAPDAAPPKSLMPVDPIILLRYDAATDSVLWVDGEPGASMSETFVLADGLKVAVNEASMEFQRDGEIIVVGVAFDMDVLELPPGVDAKYPYNEGELKREVALYWYKPATLDTPQKVGKLEISTQMRDELRKAIQLEGGKWKLKAKGQTKNIGVADVTIDDLGEQTSTIVDEMTSHEIKVLVTPKKLHLPEPVVSTSSGFATLKVGEQVELVLNFEETKKSERKK